VHSASSSVIIFSASGCSLYALTTKGEPLSVITAIFKDGLPNYLDFLLKEWDSLLDNPKYGDKKKEIQSCIEKVKKIKDKVYWD